jgi:trigger factor
MNAKIENVETNVVKLEVTVDAENFKAAVKKSYAKNSNKYNIPGFRKGKAPMNIIKQHYGEGVFYEDAVNFCIEETYPKAVEENNLQPVDYPEIDVLDLGEGKALVYTAKVTVKPEVELGEYKGLEVVKPEYPVNDEEVEKQLKTMAEKNARIESKEAGAVENGDVAVIDFKGYIDGVAFEGGEGKDFSLEIGSGSFIGDFEQQLIGAVKGEKRDVNVAFPENYGREELNGKPAHFEVTINDIKAKDMPALDDEFAKEASEFDTLDELKADIRSKLEATNSAKAQREYEDAVVEAVCNNAKLEIPEVMIKKETDNMMRDFEMRLKYQGLDLNTYYSYTNSSEEKMREYLKDGAEKKVKTELVLEKIAETEKLEATEEEIKEKAEAVAKQYGEKDLDRTVKMLLNSQAEYLKLDVINEKVLKLLIENSKATA